MAGLNDDVSFILGVTNRRALSDDSSNVSDSRSSTLSGVWNGSSLDESVLSGTFVAVLLVSVQEVHWGGHFL